MSGPGHPLALRQAQAGRERRCMSPRGAYRPVDPWPPESRNVALS